MIDKLYASLSEDNEEAFVMLWIFRYCEELLFLHNKRFIPKRSDEIEELLEMYLSGLLGRKVVLEDGKEEKVLDELVKVDKIPKSSKITRYARKELKKILSAPNSVTQVVYETEVLRKRDRAKEAVESTVGIRSKQIELDRQLVQWARFTGWYSDIITEDACETAIIDAGIGYVRWVTSKDDKVCGECEELEGKVFKANEIPDHPHRNCRCTVTPVRR